MATRGSKIAMSRFPRDIFLRLVVSRIVVPIKNAKLMLIAKACCVTASSRPREKAKGNNIQTAIIVQTIPSIRNIDAGCIFKDI